MKNKIISGLVLSTTMLIVNTASAENVQATMNASATLENSCTIKASNVDFGQLDLSGPMGPGGGPNFYTTRANPGTVLCSKDVPFTVSLNGGGSSDGDQKHMLHENGTDKLLYNVYMGPAQAAPIFKTLPGVGTGTPVNFGMHMRVNSMNNGQKLVKAGNYSDQLELSVEY